ncbi:protein kinase, partial [bacterium]|nr:protein kinase [candidate division CSSED10-310 bacterium]
MNKFPSKFGRFAIDKLLGIGGTGRVYRVWDPNREEYVALKVLHVTDTSEDSTSRLRFRREFRAASRLKHPHLVNVYETGVIEDLEYYTMEFIAGHDFDEYIYNFTSSLKTDDKLNDPRRIKRIIELLLQICDALAYLHSNRYVHRDMKPGNVLVSHEGNVKLADFGLVRDLASSQLTHTGSILGTVEYMSPEQTVTAKVDARSDIYSLGIMAYKAFSGKLPFTGSMMQQLISRTKDEAPDPRTINPKMDRRIAQVIAQMLKRRPEERFPNAQVLLEKLVEIMEKLFDTSAATTTTSMTIEAPVSVVLPPSCVGRARELRHLQRALDQMRTQSASSLFLIKGETGTGKTRLTEEFRTIAAFHNVPFFKTETPEKSGSDFHCWVDIIDLCTNEFGKRRIPLSKNLATVIESLNPVLSLLKTHQKNQDTSVFNEATRYQFFDATNRFLALFSSQIPAIFHLEDFHRADAASAELLQFLARRTIFTSDAALSPEFKGRMIFLVTYRENELPADHPLARLERIFSGEDNLNILELKSLSEKETEEMIMSMLGSEHASPNFSYRIHQETLGNPLFIESTINTLVDEGILRRRGGIWVGAVSRSETLSISDSMSLMLPASIKESARRRLAGLSETEETVVQAGAILGVRFTFDQLMYVASKSEDEMLDAVDILLKCGLFEEKSQDEEVYGFTSVHLKEVILESLSDNQKQLYHSKAAEILEKETKDRSIGLLSRLAHHYIVAGDFQKGYFLSRDVAYHHFNRGNSDQALYYIDHALELAVIPDEEEKYRLKLTRAHCLLNLGKLADAKALFMELIKSLSRNIYSQKYPSEMPKYSSLLCRSMYGLSRIMIEKTQLEQARKLLTKIVEKSQICS